MAVFCPYGKRKRGADQNRPICRSCGKGVLVKGSTLQIYFNICVNTTHLSMPKLPQSLQPQLKGVSRVKQCSLQYSTLYPIQQSMGLTVLKQNSWTRLLLTSLQKTLCRFILLRSQDFDIWFRNLTLGIPFLQGPSFVWASYGFRSSFGQAGKHVCSNYWPVDKCIMWPIHYLHYPLHRW